jgi:hypothetical protein
MKKPDFNLLGLTNIRGDQQKVFLEMVTEQAKGDEVALAVSIAEIEIIDQVMSILNTSGFMNPKGRKLLNGKMVGRVQFKEALMEQALAHGLEHRKEALHYALRPDDFDVNPVAQLD